MASTSHSGDFVEASALEAMLAEHERQLDELLDHVIGVLAEVRETRQIRAAAAAESRPEPTRD